MSNCLIDRGWTEGDIFRGTNKELSKEKRGKKKQAPMNGTC
jgi:hypothetical protein